MRYLLLGLIVSLNSACTTMRTVEVPDPQVAVQSIEIGDTVEVVKVDGSKLRFEVTEVEPDALVGTIKRDGRQETVRVPIEEIRIVSIAELDALKTTAATAVSAVVVGALVFIAGAVWMLSTW